MTFCLQRDGSILSSDRSAMTIWYSAPGNSWKIVLICAEVAAANHSLETTTVDSIESLISFRSCFQADAGTCRPVVRSFRLVAHIAAADDCVPLPAYRIPARLRSSRLSRRASCNVVDPVFGGPMWITTRRVISALYGTPNSPDGVSQFREQRANLPNGALIDRICDHDDLVCAGGGKPRKMGNNFTRTPLHRRELLSERTLR